MVKHSPKVLANKEKANTHTQGGGGRGERENVAKIAVGQATMLHLSDDIADSHGM